MTLTEWNKAVAAIIIYDKIQSHDRISLVHNIATLHDSASIEASVIRYLQKMDPKLLHNKTNETAPRTPTTSSSSYCQWHDDEI